MAESMCPPEDGKKDWSWIKDKTLEEILKEADETLHDMISDFDKIIPSLNAAQTFIVASISDDLLDAHSRIHTLAHSKLVNDGKSTEDTINS